MATINDAIQRMQNAVNKAHGLSGNYMQEMTDLSLEKEEFENGYASIFYQQIKDIVLEFNESLDSEHEVGMRLVNYGESIRFHLTEISYSNPYLIHLSGILDEGSPIVLVQHVSQISFVMIKMKRREPDKPKMPIGFKNN